MMKKKRNVWTSRLNRNDFKKASLLQFSKCKMLTYCTLYDSGGPAACAKAHSFQLLHRIQSEYYSLMTIRVPLSVVMARFRWSLTINWWISLRLSNEFSVMTRAVFSTIIPVQSTEDLHVNPVHRSSRRPNRIVRVDCWSVKLMELEVSGFVEMINHLRKI